MSRPYRVIVCGKALEQTFATLIEAESMVVEQRKGTSGCIYIEGCE